MSRRATIMGQDVPVTSWEDRYGTDWRDPWAQHTQPDNAESDTNSPRTSTTGTENTRPKGTENTLLGRTLGSLRTAFTQQLSRRQRIAAGVAVVALVCVAALLLLPHGTSTTQVARLTRAMSSGSEVTTTDVHWVEVPSALLPARAVTSQSQLAGRRLVGDAERGELLTEVRLSTPRLPDGWRALGLPASGMMSWQVGQHVDVVVEAGDTRHVIYRDAIIYDNPEGGSQPVGHAGAVLVALPEEKAYELAQLDGDAVVTLLLR